MIIFRCDFCETFEVLDAPHRHLDIRENGLPPAWNWVEDDVSMRTKALSCPKCKDKWETALEALYKSQETAVDELRSKVFSR